MEEKGKAKKYNILVSRADWRLEAGRSGKLLFQELGTSLSGKEGVSGEATFLTGLSQNHS